MHAAAVCFDLHVPESRSLKQKRATLRPVIDGLRHRFRLSVAEVGGADLLQRAQIGVAVVAGDADRVDAVLTNVARFVDAAPGVVLLEASRSWLDSEGVLGGEWG